MKKRNKHTITVLLGCLVAITMICSQLFQFHSIPQAKKEVKTDQQESDRSADEAFISLPSFSLPSPVHVQVNLDSYCLFEILFEDQRQIEPSCDLPLSPQKFFVTLFRVIISPNAP